MNNKTCVIVGASHAGCQLAFQLRHEGWEGKILLIGEEKHLPYHRPPLSKDFLKGHKTLDNILIRPAAAYEKANIDVLLGPCVKSILRDRHILLLDNGQEIVYDKLALAVGSRVRRVAIPGSEKAGVYYLRDANDIESIRPFVKAGGRAVIVGGGYIGLETAAALRQLDMGVTVLEMMPRVLQRVTAPALSEFYTRVHHEEGVEIFTGVAVSTIEGNAHAEVVVDANGNRYPADLVIIGAGIVPNVELAQAAGLEVDNGIVVDEFARTNDPDIVAAGDCAKHHNFIYDVDLRLESVQNAHDQAKAAAATLCGKLQRYDALPWFWSDQYDLKLQIAGLSQGFDDVVIRGDIEHSRKFAAFYFKGDRLLAVDAVNSPKEFMQVRRLLTAKIPVSKIDAENPEFDLSTIK